LDENLRKSGGHVLLMAEDSGFVRLDEILRDTSVLMDGLLGTGSKPPVRGDVQAVLAKTNEILVDLESAPFVVAVDCPSGVDCDTGAVSEDSISADLTVTMAAVKNGLVRLPAYELVGDLQVVDIGLPDDLKTLRTIMTDVADAERVASILPRRAADSHKGTFGTAMVVAGSVNYTGAALLAGEAAYRAGAGLVTLAVPSLLHSALAGQLPEATWLLLPHETGVMSRDGASILLGELKRATALLIGPGLGMESTTADFLARVLAGATASSGGGAPMGFIGASAGSASAAARGLPPLVIDADALKLVAGLTDWHKRLPDRTILTPHPGEMAILTRLPVSEIQADRVATATRFSREWGHVVVLKGAFTVVASPDGQSTTIPVATAALARAGTGDVLAGLIVGLRAQGLEPYPAALAGAWIHAQAGLLAAAESGSEASVLARDVLAAVTQVMADLSGR
jgi:NAD(P)H-hydrate epimerase